MSDEILRKLGDITVRARAAYFLTIGEWIFRLGVSDTVPEFAPATAFLKTAWRWVGSEPASANELYACLDNDEENGLFILEQDAIKRAPAEDRDKQNGAWNSLVVAVMYVVWRAYELEGAKYVPQTIESVHESIIDDLFAYASKSSHLTMDPVTRLRRFLSERYPAIDTDELGPPVSRADTAPLVGMS